MKSFKLYLAESVRTYKYRLRLVGDVDKKLLQLIEINLQKFSICHMGEPKTSMIQKSIPGFPEIENDRVTTIDVDFRYPVIEPFVKQMARLLGLDENRVSMVTRDFDTANASDAEDIANRVEKSPILLQTELEDKGKEASKAYGDSYLSSVKDQTKDKIEMKFDGKVSGTFDPFAKPSVDTAGTLSPMSKMTRPEKPATGSSK